MNRQFPRVSLEGRLRRCAHVITLGVRPNFDDYTPDEQELIRSADTVYYPSALYAELLSAMGKRSFPSCHCYRFAQDKVKQTALFQLAGIPHPRTHIFYGPRQKRSILDRFAPPFIAKVARGSALGRGVFLITTEQELERYCADHSPAYIQEYLPIDRDIRVVVIGYRPVLAYWRISTGGEYRSNVARGAQIDSENVPQAAVDLAVHTARACQWDDVGLDICLHNGRYYVLEANMKYGREGFRHAGMDYDKMMECLLINGDI